MANDPYKYFRPEARDLVDQAAKGVLELEKGEGGIGAVQKLLRVAHTLKGAARIVKQSEIAGYAHAIEDVLSRYRDVAQTVARAEIDAILTHLDAISRQLGTLDTPAPSAPEKAASRTKSEPDKRLRTVRTDIAETDVVLEGIAQAHALLSPLRKTAQGVEQMRRLSHLLLAQFTATGSAEHGRPAPRGFKQRAAVADEFRRWLAGVQRDLRSVIDQMDRELSQLREAAERLRLVSVDTLFTALERIARDTASAQMKQVVFEGRGGETRLDSHVLETIQAALVQVIRNGVAHGIESEAERIAAGKPRAGRVCLTVSRRGRKLVFECSDDGRGIDRAAVRQSAQQRGLIEPTARSSDDLVEVLLRGGITTSKTVTDVSGRGVGLDIVREAIVRLSGEVSVRTHAGVGTTFSLCIPPSLASMDALTVDTGAPAGIVAIPFECVRTTLRIGPNQIADGPAGASFLFQERAIPFIPLASALDGTPWLRDRNWTTIIVAGSQGLAAVGVERLVGTSGIVVRPLPAGMEASSVVAGASLDAEGNPQLVLDPDGLVAAASRGSAKFAQVAPRAPILIVDDSITTRMLEKSILESAGHNVEVALSGEEALGRVREKRYGVILVDVEMPGMDGFTLIERIRSDAAVGDIPAILVSSRAAPEDLERGREAGAQGYILKSEFDQAQLLAMIDRLAR